MSSANTERSSAGRGLWSALAWIALAAAIVTGGAVWWYKSQPYHLLVTEPGVLYRSGRLEPEVLTEVIEKYGIKTVVNCKGEAENREPWHAVEIATTEAAGAKHFDIVLEPDTPPTPEQVAQWLSILDDPARRPVIVHCQHGVVRTGMLVGVFEMEFQGKSNAEVADGFVTFGHDLTLPRSDAMWAFFRGYTPRSR